MAQALLAWAAIRLGWLSSAGRWGEGGMVEGRERADAAAATEAAAVVSRSSRWRRDSLGGELLVVNKVSLQMLLHGTNPNRVAGWLPGHGTDHVDFI